MTADLMDRRGKAAAHGGRLGETGCAATSQQSGQRCKRLPVPGGRVCVIHGGAAPQAARASLERLRHSAAAEACNTLGVPHPAGAWPVELPGALAALKRARKRGPAWYVAATRWP